MNGRRDPFWRPGKLAGPRDGVVGLSQAPRSARPISRRICRWRSGSSIGPASGWPGDERGAARRSEGGCQGRPRGHGRPAGGVMATDGRHSVAKVSAAHRPARPDTTASSAGRARCVQCGRSNVAGQVGVSSSQLALRQRILDGEFDQLGADARAEPFAPAFSRTSGSPPTHAAKSRPVRPVFPLHGHPTGIVGGSGWHPGRIDAILREWRKKPAVVNGPMWPLPRSRGTGPGGRAFVWGSISPGSSTARPGSPSSAAAGSNC